MLSFLITAVLSGAPMPAAREQRSPCRMSKASCKRLRQLIENDVEFIGTLDQDVDWYLTKQIAPVKEPEPYGTYPTEKRDQ